MTEKVPSYLLSIFLVPFIPAILSLLGLSLLKLSPITRTVEIQVYILWEGEFQGFLQTQVRGKLCSVFIIQVWSYEVGHHEGDQILLNHRGGVVWTLFCIL